MDSSKIIILIATWVLMLLWLSFVVVSGVVAFRKWKKTGGPVKVQMLYLWLGAAVVFTGDFLHTVAATVSAYTSDATGPIHVLGTVFEFIICWFYNAHEGYCSLNMFFNNSNIYRAFRVNETSYFPSGIFKYFSHFGF